MTVAFEEDPVKRFHRAVNTKRSITPQAMYELWCKAQEKQEEEEEISGIRKKNADNIPDYAG